MILEKINGVKELRKLSIKDLSILSEEMREYIIDVISQNGGHLASSLGVVELTIALHYVFNTPKDQLIWDVGHQTYAHKILTGRKESFRSIRKYGGISGFPKTSESEFDSFNVGHSSTSLSLALGCAIGRDLARKKNKVVAVIGDGSLTGGMALEALNHIGHIKNELIIILNDNEHSISKNVGALSEYLTQIISGSIYNRFRRKSMEVIRKIPNIGEKLFNFIYRITGSFKGMLIPGQFFEDMGIRYFGPVDGNNLNKIIAILEKVREINSGPKIIHVITRKGKGYIPAELDPARFHGTGPFDKATGQSLSNSRFETYSEVAGQTLAFLSDTNKKIMAVTAAMKLGTGLYEFEKKAPDRFIDVGIAEQHAITLAAALSKTGMSPFVSLYSTFLQRAVDQLIHDVAIMSLPVKILIDRAGIVGDDGETHHGLFDIAILRNVPNFIILAPSSAEELRDMIAFAAEYNEGPVAIRFPRGRVDSESFKFNEPEKFTVGKLKRVTSGSDVALFTFGDMIQIAHSIRSILKSRNIDLSIINLLTIKPLDIKGIENAIKRTNTFCTLENGVLSGGVGEYISSQIGKQYREKHLFSAGFPDEFIIQGDRDNLLKQYGMDPQSLAKKIVKTYTQKK